MGGVYKGGTPAYALMLFWSVFCPFPGIVRAQEGRQGMNVATALKRVFPFGKKDADGPAMDPEADGDDRVRDDDRRASDDGPSAKDEDTGFPTRFMAWWEGCDVTEYQQKKENMAAEQADDDVENRPPPLSAVPSEPEKESEDPVVYWNPARIHIAELLWGEGETQPGGAERTLEMVASFGVQKESNVLNIGSGLGGALREIAKKFDVWVSGYEVDEHLAAAGIELSHKAGMAKKAEINHVDMENLTLRGELFDCGYSRETIHTVKDKEKLLSAVQMGLKMDASFLITDYVVEPGRDDDPAVARWIEAQPRPVYPWTAVEAQELLRQLNFEIRVDQNITAQLREDVFSGWEQFIAGHERKGIPSQLQLALLETATAWAHCIEALDSGALQVYRFVSIKK